MNWIKTTLFSALLLTNLALAGTARAAETDLNLVLAIDCSFSVSRAEYKLQMEGTANAFLDQAVLNAIQSGRFGQIGVTVVQWSNDDSQIVIVPWTSIGTKEEAKRLALAISGAPRLARDGATSISKMIEFGIVQLDQAPFQSDRRTIDIAGDGENNIGPNVRTARDLAVSLGITINGLAIVNAREKLHIYYRNNVIGGIAPFVEVANDYSDYASAIKAKLLKEIQQPGS